MKIFHNISLPLVLCCPVIAQHVAAQGFHGEPSDTVQIEFLPSGLHFLPLKANFQEARVGVFTYFGTSNLKVDIGNTIDVASMTVASSQLRLTIGIEFMAYAYTTGAQGLRLQVDAIDGFFGGNVAVSQQNGESHLCGRLRILHQSAHMVDGQYFLGTNQWLGNRRPIPFTRDFGELTVAHELRPQRFSLRYYGGTSYATLVRPSELKRFSVLAGFELAIGELLGKVLGHRTNVFFADHFTLTGAPNYAASNQLQVGVKFGRWHGKGIVFYLSYYAGNNFFGQYYNEKVTIAGAGFTVDFP